MVVNFYMQRCVQLALLGGKATKSNPMVGCVIVYQDRIIGEGFHQQFGGPHAEVNAINSVDVEDKYLLQFSTLYVSLEPCNNYGKTPPCSDRILETGIKKVVIGCLDPNPYMSGKTIALLKENGIEVELLNDEAALFLIRKFNANLNKRPYVILKWAQSFDNFMGHKEKQIWISNEISKTYSHKWRTEVDAIMIGKNTAMIDNPQLTPRLVDGDVPIRVLMDTNLEVSKSSHLFIDGHKTIVFNAIKEETINNVEFIKADTNNVHEILVKLYNKGIYSMIIEGGKALHNAFIKAQLWDEARIIRSKIKLGNDANLILAPVLEGHLQTEIELDEDEIIFISNKF